MVLPMTKHRAHRIGGAPVRGSPPLAAHQPPGVVAVAAAAITRPRLSTPLCAMPIVIISRYPLPGLPA